jgi:hypothetical protein
MPLLNSLGFSMYGKLMHTSKIINDIDINPRIAFILTKV